jgi:hypothetical protein
MTLQSQIQSSFQQQSGLSGVMVNVTDSGISLSGTVETGKEKQTAKRIAQSYAGSRKVEDNITVSGKGQGSGMSGSMGGSQSMGTGSTGNSTSSDSTTNPSNPSSSSNPSNTTTPTTPPTTPQQ